MTPTLRPATDEDAWGLIALIGACWGEYPGCVMDVHGECRELLSPATAFADAAGQLWVLTDACGTVIASVGYQPRGTDVVELERLYVAWSWRRQGWGRRLAGLVEDAARHAGAAALELWSDSRFADAHVLYDALGYRRSGRERELHDLSHTVEWHFSKALSSPNLTLHEAG